MLKLHRTRPHTGLSLTLNPLFSQAMHRDHQRWYSHRLNRDMGVAIYGNYGAPILAFPTSWATSRRWKVRDDSHLSPYIEAGRIRIFCINGVQSDSFSNKGAHPFHRSWMQAQYDDYVANEVFPFIDSSARRRASGSPPWAHRSAPITRPTLSSSIPTT
jgi:esterase/lipase superfamily enzyme